MSALMLLAALAAITHYVRKAHHDVPPSAHVVDGDTIDFDGRRWRIAGYDAPEWNQPGGREATDALRRIVRGGGVVALDVGDEFYGRGLARLHVRHVPLAWRMALAGHGHGEGPVGGLLTIAARIGRRGLWSGGRIVHPRAWRALHPHP